MSLGGDGRVDDPADDAAHGRDELVAWCRGVDEGPWASLAVPERVAAVEAAGADEVILVPTTADPTELEATAEALR